MKWIVFLTAFIICAISVGMGQTEQYSGQTAEKAPIPVTPTSPEALGLDTPSVTMLSTSQQATIEQENSPELIKADQQMAYSASPGVGATSTSSTYTQMIVPTGTSALVNRLYIFYAPLTVAGCNLYSNVPLWLQIYGSGDIWFYEWYPSGSLETNYAGYMYSPDWYKRWFVADTPGWHILQYYCKGWSNYAYIYVYGSSGGVSPAPTPMNPVNPYEAECEKDPWCNWMNGKCVCESFTQSDNSERQSCEQKPYCNWVNGECLCTGLMPSITYGGDSNEMENNILIIFYKRNSDFEQYFYTIQIHN